MPWPCSRQFPPEAVESYGLRALWQLVSSLGFAPALAGVRPRRCRAPEKGTVRFSLTDGGALCDPCAHERATIELPREALDDLAALMLPDADLPFLDARHLAAHRRLLARWVRTHLAEAADLPALESWQQRNWLLTDHRHGGTRRSREVGAGDGADRAADGPPCRRAQAGDHDRPQLRRHRAGPGSHGRASSTCRGTRTSCAPWWPARPASTWRSWSLLADDGIMPQTREHLMVLEQLRSRQPSPCITKADAVDADWLALVRAEVAEWLAHSTSPSAMPIVTVRRGQARYRRAAVAAGRHRASTGSRETWTTCSACRSTASSRWRVPAPWSPAQRPPARSRLVTWRVCCRPD